MKSKQLLKKTITAVICFGMIYTAKAQTTANSLSDLQSQFATAVASGVPSTINIGAAIAVNANLPLVSTGDSITLNFTTTAITVTAGTLTIGNKVRVTSSLGNSIQALAGGTVVVNSGSIINSNATSPIATAGGNVIINGGKIVTTNYPAISAGSSLGSGGILTINGGYIASYATGTLTRGIVVDYLGTCIVNGGEIHADPSVSGRAVSINSTSTGGKIYVNGGTISALGTSGRAIQLDNNNSTLWVTGSPIITGGLEAIMAQKNGVVFLSGTPLLTGVIGTNAATAKLYDTRGLSNIVVTPGAGAYKTSQNVTVTGGTGTIYKYVNTTAQASATTLTTITLVYTTDGTTPIAASTAYTAPFTVAVPSVLSVAPFFDGTAVGSPTVFNYSYVVSTDVSQVQASDLFKCYPSQVTDKLIVKADAETQISQVVVRNLLGQSIKSVVVNANEQSIDLTAVSAGNYLVTVKLVNGQSATKKIVKL